MRKIASNRLFSTYKKMYGVLEEANNAEDSIVLLATQILVLLSVADVVVVVKNEVRVRFAGSLPSLLLKIEQKVLLHWIPNIVLHTYRLLRLQNRTIINENT